MELESDVRCVHYGKNCRCDEFGKGCSNRAYKRTSTSECKKHGEVYKTPPKPWENSILTRWTF